MGGLGYRMLADGLVLLHLAFIVFVPGGGFLALRWPRLVWVHLPCAAWGVWVELSGRVCPLTPLENACRMRAGQRGYTGGFVEHYVIPAIYPEELTRTIQVSLGLIALAANLVAYGLILHRNRAAQPQ
jgi:hypothetical protein